MSEYSLGLIARCDPCNRETRVKDEFAGRTLRCRQCGGEFTITTAQHESAAAAPNAPQHNAMAPGAMAPGAMAPGAMAPGAMAPGAMAPGAMAPGAMAPGAMAPGAMAPGAMAPGAMAPGAMAPGAMAPGAMAPGAMAPGAMYRQPTDSNSIAVFGFVLALFGICSAATLSPVALGCSIVGLRKEHNKGYAIAGTIISSIQLVLLVLGIVQFLIIGRFFWQAGEELGAVLDEVQERAITEIGTHETERAIGSTIEMVDDHAMAIGELPSTEEGARLIEFKEDGWGTKLKYRPTEGRLPSFTIQSAGPDRRWDSADDIGRVVPSPIVTSASEAIVLLKEEDPRRQRLGLAWLQESSPEVASRTRVVQALMPLTKDQELGSAATRALALWAEPEELRDLAEAAGIEGADVVAAIVEAQDTVKPENLLALINDRDFSTRSKAREAIEQSSIASEDVISQCIADLEDDTRETAALDYLATLTFDEATRQKVKAAVVLTMYEGDAAGIRTRRAMQILNRAGITDEDIPTLTKVYPRCNHDEVFEVLIQHIDADMINQLLSEMDAPGATASRAGTFFARMGPAGESHLWALLSDGTPAGRLNAFAVLRKIGTSRSIPHLEALLEDAAFERGAKNTIDAIRAADRQPSVPLTPEANAP